jgi:hypothetical protein
MDAPFRIDTCVKISTRATLALCLCWAIHNGRFRISKFANLRISSEASSVNGFLTVSLPNGRSLIAVNFLDFEKFRLDFVQRISDA